ncbi:MAG: amidohydrolase family protein [Clostridia bacterium]|nr:amidohydrolase family protein [Clostridia bacterium]
MLIDFHTHAFPDRIAARAVEKLSDASGGMEYYTDGTAGGLVTRMKASGVDRSVVLSIATNAHQQKSVNDFAACLNEREELIAFGSVFPSAPDALEELERIAAMGLKGVKLHPDYQGFSVDDPALFPLYKKISSLGLVTVFHAGVDYGFAPPYGNTPEKLVRALEQFESPVVAAHWGGVGCYADVLALLAGADVYFDTSFGYAQMPKYYAEKILERHGADRLLFGTDSPWHTAEMELRLLSSLGLSQDEWEKITHKNAERLLGL